MTFKCAHCEVSVKSQPWANTSLGLCRDCYRKWYECTDCGDRVYGPIHLEDAVSLQQCDDCFLENKKCEP